MNSYFEVLQAIRGELYSDYVDEPNNFPSKRPLLAHYTSLDVAMSIIENGEIWFSHPFHMNDKNEYLYGIHDVINKCGEDLLSRSGSAKKNHLLQKYLSVLNHYASNFELNQEDEVYVWCLSEHSKKDYDGLLSMWRGYASNAQGVAIVFDSSKFNYSSNGSPFAFGKVGYYNEKARIRYVLKKIKRVIEIIDRDFQLTLDDLYRDVPYFLVDFLKDYSLFSKHIGFKEELEWRVVYNPALDEAGDISKMIDYRVGPRGISPVLKLDLADVRFKKMALMDGLDSVIDRIILGPALSTKLAKEAVNKRLIKAGMQSISEKLHCSSIPFRS